MEDIKKQDKYSYSRLSQYKSCPFCYDLKYNQKKFISADTLVTLLGTLIHHIEEEISLSLMEGHSPNYKALIEEIHDANVPKTNPYDKEGGIFGVEILKQQFTQEYYTPSKKTGLSYLVKVNKYIENIQRQENFMLVHPELELFDVEHEFVFQYGSYNIGGFIDRILKYKGQNKYQIHDIKTRDRYFDDKDIKTPLQHAIYGMALKDQLGLDCEPEEYYYDLVFIQEYQAAGTKGFMKRAQKQLDKIFAGIELKDFPPKPTPLCYWCDYSNTNPDVTPEGQNCCPYYSKWTPENSTYETMFSWEGPEKTKFFIEKLEKRHPAKMSKFEF